MKKGQSPSFHGEASPRTLEYTTWVGMLHRCLDPRPGIREHYLDRGICVCDEWKNSYEAFLAHVGRRPSPAHTLDRIDNNRGYEPGNVRWATAQEQNFNRGNNRVVVFRGESRPITEWAALTGVHVNTLRYRHFVKGLPMEAAVVTAVGALRKLDAEQTAELRERFAQGAAKRALAREYGISSRHVGRLCAGVSPQQEARDVG